MPLKDSLDEYWFMPNLIEIEQKESTKKSGNWNVGEEETGETHNFQVGFDIFQMI